MNISRFFLVIVSLAIFSCQMISKTEDNPHRQTVGGPDASLRRRERELDARLRWEILWKDAPQGFRVPEGGKARLTAYQKGDSFYYCSHDLGVCVRYGLEERRLGQPNNSIMCDDDQDDMSSVLQFAGEKPKQLPVSGQMIQGLANSGGLLWTLILDLGTKEETLEHYRQSHPTELEGLRAWLLKTLQGAGYSSVTIACFVPSDPAIFIYGDRPITRGGPIVFSVRWDSEREEWVDVGMLEREQGPEKFEELKATIQSIACDTIKFN